MKIRIFELERVQSLYENTVEFNLTESGFHPLKLNEFLTAEQLADKVAEAVSELYLDRPGDDAIRADS